MVTDERKVIGKVVYAFNVLIYNSPCEILSETLKLYRNAPQYIRDSWIERCMATNILNLYDTNAIAATFCRCSPANNMETLSADDIIK